jgi:hypothetical protein
LDDVTATNQTSLLLVEGTLDGEDNPKGGILETLGFRIPF